MSNQTEIRCPQCEKGIVLVDLPEGAAGWRAQCAECGHEWPYQQQYFQGELMTCFICGRQQKSDPNKRSNWSIVEWDSILFYVCTKHFTPDHLASQADYKHDYLYVLRKIKAKLARQNLN